MLETNIRAIKNEQSKDTHNKTQNKDKENTKNTTQKTPKTYE